MNGDDAQIVTPVTPASSTPLVPAELSPITASERFLSVSGMALVLASISSFITLIFIEFRAKTYLPDTARWLDLFSQKSSTIVLLIVGVICALLGLRLLTTTQNALARTIPKDDYPLIRDAVIAGKPDPIDQYVRLRSLAGWAGTFTKLGITGLPLVTVVLTLIFTLVALFPGEKTKDFLDLAKLTLGAFIGSFVQRNVEQRKADASAAVQGAPPTSPSLPV